MRNLKKFLALVLALMMVVSVMVTVSAADYTDQADIDYDEAVAVMTAVGMVEGGDQGQFDPDSNLTRAQAATLIVRLLRGTEEGLGAPTAPFIDVPATHWAAGAINYCSLNNLIDGDGQGHFYPDEGVTGVQMAKLLLVALGYDSKNEGFTGADWERNVATIALGSKVNMLKGGNFAIDKKEISRQEACLMAFNTIQAETVEYSGGTNVTLADGTTITVNATRTYSGAANPFYTRYDLKPYASSDSAKADDDAFGRDSTPKWVNDKGDAVVYAEPSTATKTYTKKADAAQFAKDYPDAHTKVASAISGNGVYVDGAQDKTTKTVSAIGGLIKNGTTVEVYSTKSGDEITINNVVVIKTYAKKLADTDIKAAKGETPAYIVLGGANYPTTAYKAGDVVSYNLGKDDEDNTVALNVKALTPSITGKVTSTGTDPKPTEASYVRVEKGDKLYANETFTGFATALALGNTQKDVYLDDAGFVLFAEDHKNDDAPAAETNYLYILTYEAAAGSGTGTMIDQTGTDAQVKAKVLDPATGETSVIDIAIVKDGNTWYYAKTDGTKGAKVENEGISGTETKRNNTFVTYTETDLGYVLGDTVGVTKAEDLAIAQGKAEVTVTKDGAKRYADANTRLVVIEVETKDDASTYTVKTDVTGYTNFPAVKGDASTNVLVTPDSGAVKAIYVIQNKASETTTPVGVYAGKGETTADGTTYQFYVDGALTDYVSANAELKDTNASAELAAGKVYALTVTDGKLTKADSTEGTLTSANLTKVEETTGLEMVTDSYVVLSDGSTIHYLADGCAVYTTETDANDNKTVSTTTVGVGDKVTMYTDKTKESKVVLIIVDAKYDKAADTRLSGTVVVKEVNAGSVTHKEGKGLTKDDITAKVDRSGKVTITLKAGTENKYIADNATITLTFKPEVSGAQIQESTSAQRYGPTVDLTFTCATASNGTWAQTNNKVKIQASDGTEGTEITITVANIDGVEEDKA